MTTPDRSARIDRHLSRRRTLDARADLFRRDEREFLAIRRELVGR